MCMFVCVGGGQRQTFYHKIACHVRSKNKSQRLLKLLLSEGNLTRNFCVLYPARTGFFNPSRKLGEFDPRGHRKSCS